jgi:hypothetical protein
MGTPMAVVFANLYLLVLEWETFEILNKSPTFIKPLTFVKFIDDLFLASTDYANGILFLNTFNTRREKIKLDITEGLSVIFLDLEMFILICDGYCQILIKIYQKPMNRYLYIPQFSHHQPSVFSSFILSEIRRYRLSCSLDSDFESTCKEFKIRLSVRGYDDKIYDQCKQTFNKTRMEILFTGKCKDFYEEIQNTPLPTKLYCRPFTPFRETKIISQDDNLLLFKIPHAPGPTNKEIKSAIIFDSFQNRFQNDYFAAALAPFQKAPVICKSRTYKIQDSLIRSKLTQDLPDNF